MYTTLWHAPQSYSLPYNPLKRLRLCYLWILILYNDHSIILLNEEFRVLHRHQKAHCPVTCRFLYSF